jgi:hypothetical protein
MTKNGVKGNFYSNCGERKIIEAEQDDSVSLLNMIFQIVTNIDTRMKRMETNIDKRMKFPLTPFFVIGLHKQR